MSVFRPRGMITWWYDFRWRGRRYAATTHQTRREDAQLVEAQVKLQLRQRAGGIAPFDPQQTPRFQDWAEVSLAYQRRFTDRPDVLERTLHVVLEFWGARPRRPPKRAAVARPRRVEAPYHDLRLGDPIASPSWIRRFEEWISARGVSGSTRNTYLSALSGLYRTALQPEYRDRGRVEINPFREIRRSPPRPRLVALEPDVIRCWVQEASYHVALAATIAALAPKLRLGTILALRWDAHLDRDWTRIIVPRHKTSGWTGAPQVVPISQQLRDILQDARSRQPSATHLITWRDEPVTSIKTGTKRAVEAIGLTWGLQGGVTFHTLRHSIATLLATLGLSEAMRQELMGHREIRTTQRYTHLAALTQVQPHEQLSQRLPLRDALLAKPRPLDKALASARRSRRTGAGAAAPPARARTGKPRGNTR